MKKWLIIVLLMLLPAQAMARLTIQITGGTEGALPIAVVPFGWSGRGAAGVGAQIAEIVRSDLIRSGRFTTLPVKDMLARPQTGSDVEFRDWKVLGMDNLVVGQVSPNGKGGYMVRFQLFDVFKSEQLTGYNIPTTERGLRVTAHQIADIIYEKLTGQPGAFATRIAYVTSVQQGDGAQQVALKVADADGFNPQTIVTSSEPLMSPSWSPDGRRLAYVSFENKKASIYIQEVFTGRRQKIASFKGINGAPAWSPDGRHVVFTSDRGGKPQIYRVPSFGGKVTRITFEGRYNARASYAPDGKSLTLVTSQGGGFRIGVLDLETNGLLVLSDGRLDESPSFAPNGSMIIYATKINGRGELAAVSVDGRIKQRLALQEGDVREPVWSPYTKTNRRTQ